MAIDYSVFAIPKGQSRYETKKDRQAKSQAHEREVYAAVTLRDGSRCRVCGRWCNPRALSLLEKPHHHHLQYKSKGKKTGVTESWNLSIMCSGCHDQ